MNNYPVWWEELTYFRPDEIYRTEKGTRKKSFPYPERMDEDMMKRLDKARGIAGVRFTVTSSFRPDDDGAHGKGLAVDIRVRGIVMRTKVFFALWKVGFLRVGVYDKHVHGDMDKKRPSGIWGGVSK